MWNSIKNQLRSVIEWQNPAPTTLFEKWSSNSDEIKNASKLIVGPGQGCIFVYEGKVEGVFTNQGVIDLKTANIPFWTTVTKFMQAFISEHKVGLYFFKTTQLVDLKWGTPSIIKYEDPKYKFPVGLRCYGNFSIQIKQADWFFQNILGARDFLGSDELREMINSRIIQPLTDEFAEAHLSYTEIDAHRNELATDLVKKLNSDFEKLGFTLLDFRIEGTSFDEETQKRINRIADLSAEAQAANAAGISYAQMQQLEALKEAAKNPGGAGTFMGIGVGVGMGQQMGGVMGGVASSNPQASEDPSSRLKKLKELMDQGLITADEFDAKKKEILSKI